MELIWSAQANLEWKKTASKIFDEFGRKAVERYLLSTRQWERHLLQSPECGFPEPLLADKKIHYRSILISKHSKLIYYLKGDIIRIADVWDMRRNPEILSNRIKTKNK